MSDFQKETEQAISKIKHDHEPDLEAIRVLLRQAQEHYSLLSVLLSGDIEFDKLSRGAYDDWEVRLECQVSNDIRKELFRFLGE